jgi:hypothetical protein
MHFATAFRKLHQILPYGAAMFCEPQELHATAWRNTGTQQPQNALNSKTSWDIPSRNRDWIAGKFQIIIDVIKYLHVYQLRWLAYLSVTNPMLFWKSCWFRSNSRCVANVFITADSRFRAKTSTRTLAERHWSVLDMCDIICIKQGRLT